jgi:chromosome segregation ATPase
VTTRAQKAKRLGDELHALEDRRRRVLGSLGDLDRAIAQVKRLVEELKSEPDEKPKGGTTR